MEPYGLMDNRSLDDKCGNFSVCDVADEEVHFSKEVLVSHQPFNQAYKQQQQLHQHHHASQPSYANFTDINLNNNSCQSSYHQYQQQNSPQQAEQAKSSKLLNSIGLKLRRGSNFLAVPKLVGHYLLGITIQNWSEFFCTARMMKAPNNANQLTRRLLANLAHFQGNYLCVSLILVIYCILTSPLLLLAIIAYLIALYMVTARSASGRHLKIANFRPNLQQQYSFITLISLPLLWIAGAPSAVFWVIGASFVVVGLHASMYNTERAPELSESSGHHAQLNNYHHHVSWSQLTPHQRASAKYYNHYPIAQQQNQYLSLSPSLNSSEQTSQTATAVIDPVVSSSNNKSGNSSGSSYTSAISQWVMFGSGSAGSKAGYKLAPGSSVGAKSLNKKSEVTIISQDYAGLGRVYEV